MAVSQSSKIIRYLKKRPSKSFTSRQLFLEVEPLGITSGAVSGLVSKMLSAGVIERDPSNPSQYLVKNLRQYQTKKTSTGGSKPGRTVVRKMVEPIPEPKSTEKDRKYLKLKDIPTKKLVKELMRRVKQR